MTRQSHPLDGDTVDPDARQGVLPADTDPGLLKRNSVRGAAATFVGQITRFVLQFGSQILLARLLLPAEFGLVAMIGPVLSFVAIFTDLGLTQATVQRPSITQAELSALFWINVGVSAALALLVALSAPLIALFYNEPRLTEVVACLAVLLVLGGLSAQHVAVMNRHMRFGPLAVMDVACTMLSVVAGLTAAWFGLSYWSLVVMQAVNSLTILVLAWSGSGWRPSRPRRVPGVLRLLQFGGHLTVYNLVNYLGANLDSILIGKLGGSAALGLYDRAFKLVAAPIWTISLPLARVAVSLLSRLQGADQRYRRAYLQMLQMLLLITVPAVAFTVAAAGTLVPWLLGPAWVAASPIVMWLAVATGFAPLSISAYWLFVSQDRAGEQMIYAGLRTAAAICALLAGLPWGVEGVAAAYAASAVVVHGLPLWGATRRGPVGPWDVVRVCYPMLAAGSVATLAVHLAEARMASIGLAPVLRLGTEVLLSYGVCGVALLCLPGGVALLRGVWDLRSTIRPAPLPATALFR